jgi:hypothetical protein
MQIGGDIVVGLARRSSEFLAAIGGGGLVPAGPGSSPGWPQRLRDYVMDPANRPAVLRGVWVVGVVLAAILSGVSLVVSVLITGKYEAGVLVGAFLWGLLFGIGVLFLPAKLVTTVFGSLLGIGTTQALTGAGLINKANEAVTATATQIGLVVGPDVGSEAAISRTLWVFLVTTTVLCLPAFFGK